MFYQLNKIDIFTGFHTVKRTLRKECDITFYSPSEIRQG